MVAGSTRLVLIGLSRQEACLGMAFLIATRYFALPNVYHWENDSNEAYRLLRPCRAGSDFKGI